MTLTTLKIANLTPHHRNYNTHSENQLIELEKSLDQFSQFKNVVVNGENVILAGHGLVEAARRKGLTEIDAVVRDDLTEEQQTALLIADNATPFLAQPDPDMLQELLESVGDIEIPGVTDDWLHSIRVMKMSDINIDELFVDDTGPEREKKPEMITCPHCGEEIEIP